MKIYRCIICSFMYDPAVGDPANGIPPGTPFESIPGSWKCPRCGMGLEEFKRMARSA
ncbi:MAG: rubredoxin [bacterium]|nr:rubredoxin [bacterium]